jgi:hypothetical protein
MLWKFKVLYDEPITIGSVLKFKESGPRNRHGVGEVCGIIGSADNTRYEIIMYNKRFKPELTANDTYKKRIIHSKYCKNIDINCTLINKKCFELGDVVCYSFLTFKKYGVITGFVHPDGLDTTSYYTGYNGTDMIECVQINKRGLTRCRDDQNNLKRFRCSKKRLKICEVDLWDEKGVRVV